MNKKPNGSQGHFNPKCFASVLANCEGGISREHYVSSNLLRRLGEAITVSGFPWQKPGESRIVGIGSLTAKILCEKHNKELSKLDDKIGVFFSTLRKYTTEFNESKSVIQVFNGENIELWALKVVCGFIASGNFSIDGEPIPKYVREDWIKILFSKKSFPPGLGAYVFAKINDRYPVAHSLEIAPRCHNVSKNIGGASLIVGGILNIDLILMDDIKPSENQRYHPKFLNFKKNGITQTIGFSWANNGSIESIDIDMF